MATETANKAETKRLANEAADKAEIEHLAKDAADKAKTESLAEEAADKAETECLTLDGMDDKPFTPVSLIQTQIYFVIFRYGFPKNTTTVSFLI